MSRFEDRGAAIRASARTLVLDYLRSSAAAQIGGQGVRLAHIFRGCGLDWGAKKNATSSNQQYWAVAIVQSLAEEGLVERIGESGPWRLK